MSGMIRREVENKVETRWASEPPSIANAKYHATRRLSPFRTQLLTAVSVIGPPTNINHRNLVAGPRRADTSDWKEP
jgi:hypothetical protein